MEKAKILIVEDDALIALHLKTSLRRAGHVVCEPVARGEAAVALARQENPDVVLIDIRLIGDMDGIEVAQQIGEFSHAKIIFATGHADREMIERAMALKPVAYLTKPIEVDDILPLIEQD